MRMRRLIRRALNLNAAAYIVLLNNCEVELLNTKMTEYLKGLNGKRIAVIGIGVSNTPLIKILLKNGCKVTACDKTSREKFGKLADELERLGAELKLGEAYLQNLDQDIIFKTPGIRPDLPEFIAAAGRGAVITSEMEAFFEVCPCKIIAVTGSDGKTTTTTIISELLKAAGKKVYLGGNIGTPLFSLAGEMEPEDYAVLELSSFQLMTMKKSPQIAVITNISPNHLDYHKSMEEYTFSKKNIFLHQNAEDTLVLNADNEIAGSFEKSAPGKVLMFSTKRKFDNGYYYNGRSIVFAENGVERIVINGEEIKLPGLHNIENYMAAFSAVGSMVGDEVCRKIATEFDGVEYRRELIREFRGVKFYNDSMASSPTRTIAGLRSFKEKVILIAGGKDKNVSYDAMGPEIVDHVKILVLTGDEKSTVGKIKSATVNAPNYSEDNPEILVIEEFTEAVRAAADHAESGDIVLLSPASTSFDRFKNFAERGDTFKKIVNSLE